MSLFSLLVLALIVGSTSIYVDRRFVRNRTQESDSNSPQVPEMEEEKNGSN